MPVIVHVHKAVPGTFKRVDRSTVYGNPYSHKWPMGQIISKFQAKSAKDAVDKFVKYYYASEQQWLREKARKDLRGWNLGCWGCDLAMP